MGATIATPTPSQLAHAEQLAAAPKRWSRGRSKETGREFFVIPSSDGSRAHWTAADGSGCTCRGFYYRGCCSHVVAVTMAEARQAARQNPSEMPVITTVAPPRTSRYDALFPADAD